jgi:hypothetical protein
MTPLDWVVVVAGIAAIAWVNWYFFLAERRSAPAGTGKGVSGGARRDRGGRDDADDAIDHGN